MIRRKIVVDELRPQWLLIDQTAHARLASELAQHWDGLQGDIESATIIPVIDHHDDGWSGWDAKPRLDPQSGVPRDFTEMIPSQSQRIWSESIESVKRLGWLAQYMVAQHFLALAGVGDESGPTAEFGQFVEQFQRRSAGWLAAWLASARSASVSEADLAVGKLRFFDHFSLLLCCGPLSESRSIRQWHGDPVTLIPQDNYGQVFAVEPWPFRDLQLELQVTGRPISARPLSADEQLWQILEVAPVVTFKWTLKRQK